MSDQSPPPKPKPGSLRDRIAAFENKSGATPGPHPGPPPPRPKPGGLQWKPRSSSPDHSQSEERKSLSTSGMSASDAMESIGRGGSLKERMAALQGKGALGGTPPPVAPKPNLERPKWKPPPAVTAPVCSEDESKDVDVGGRTTSRSPPPRAVGSPIPDNQEASPREGDAIGHEVDGRNPDQEEERQRRAAIAARMARLGGARIGMAPPSFAPKPAVRKTELAPPEPEVKEEVPIDQAVVAESSEDLVSSPRGLLASVSPVPEHVAETEHKGEPEPASPMPSRAPTSMPLLAGPRRAAPPRKKPLKNASAALPDPPVDEAEVMAVRLPLIVDEPPATANRADHDADVTIGDSQEIGEVANTATVTHEEPLDIPRSVERHATSSPPKAFHELVEEAEKQEAEEELVVGGGRHVEEMLVHTVADDQGVPYEQPPEVAEVEEEDEAAHRERVAAMLAQMGAFNPFAGPPPVMQHPPSEESALAKDEINVDTEERGEMTSPPHAVPERYNTVQSIEHDIVQSHRDINQDNAKVDEHDQVTAHRDGDHALTSYTEEQGVGHDGHTLPSSGRSEENSIECDSVHIVSQQQERGIASAQEAEALDASSTAPLEAEEEEKGEVLLGSTITEIERSTSKREAGEDEVPPPRIRRSIPPPPVNFQSKPTSPSSPPLSPPSKTPLQTLRADEDCPASPDIPPRPIPPPSRYGFMTEDAPLHPKQSIPPPPRRTSVQLTDSVSETPSSPPLVPTSPRPVNRGPVALPIITTLAVPEYAPSEEHENGACVAHCKLSSGASDHDHVADEEKLENQTLQPEAQEDEAFARRRTITERMARLGGVRFGMPPPMNPLSRPPLPPAPPPMSIPPDETESEGKEEEGQEEEEVVRRQRIAAKLMGMGGMRLGALPPIAGLPPASAKRLIIRQEESESEDSVPPVPIPAPPQRSPPTRKPPPQIDASLEQEEQAESESRGMSDDGVHIEAEESEIEEVHYSDAEIPVASEEEDASALPSRRYSTRAPRSAEVLPTPPPRVTSRSPPPNRPPIPIIPAVLLGRRPSGATRSSSGKTPLDESSPDETPTNLGRAFESAVRAQFEYVMVEADGDEEDAPALPPPRRKSTRGPARSTPLPPPPPPSAIDPPEAPMGSVQWDLPSIPQGLEFGEGSEMASSGWSEDPTVVHVPPPLGSRGPLGKVYSPSSTTTVSASVGGSGTGSGRRSTDQQQQPQPTTEELMAIWGKVGVQVIAAAETLFEKSKRALVGDGSYAGFVRTVLSQVPGAAAHRPACNVGDDDEWGYVVYAQSGNVVQRRVSDVLPGDVVAFWDAKFKGHKGLHSYTQTAGAGAGGGTEEGGHGPLVGIVSDFDSKKSKVRIWQANQHVGQQTVENVSYRLDDLKSGQVKVYRVLEA